MLLVLAAVLLIAANPAMARETPASTGAEDQYCENPATGEREPCSNPASGADAADDAADEANAAGEKEGASEAFEGAVQATDATEAAVQATNATEAAVQATGATEAATGLTELPDTGGASSGSGPIFGISLVAGGLLLRGLSQRG